MALEDTQQQVEWNKVNVQQIRLAALDADPTDLKDGDMWHRGDLNTIRVRLNGSTVTLTTA